MEKRRNDEGQAERTEEVGVRNNRGWPHVEEDKGAVGA